MSKQVPEKSSQPSSWRTYHLNEVYDFASGLSKNRKEFGFGFPFLSFKEVFNSYFLPKMLASLANTTDVERQRCSVKRGDAFLTRTSETQEELGMSSVALVDYPNATFNGFTKRLRPNGLVEAHPEYVGYYFRSPIFRATITSMASMTTRASLNNEMLAALKIVLPPLPEQKAIAQVLSSLDDKIDLLHRQNKTLEAIAETLFCQWFIEEAQDNWEEGTLESVAENIRCSVKSEGIKANDRYIGLEHIDRRDITLKQYGSGSDVNSNKYAFEQQDILFGKLRPYFHKVCFTTFPGICSTDILVLRPRSSRWFPFCLFAFFQHDVVEYANLGSGGTRMPRTSWETLKKYPISIPDDESLGTFNNLVLPSVQKMTYNLEQMKILEGLRDALLPRLMSGEVRVDIDALTKAS